MYKKIKESTVQKKHILAMWRTVLRNSESRGKGETEIIKRTMPQR